MKSDINLKELKLKKTLAFFKTISTYHVVSSYNSRNNKQVFF